METKKEKTAAKSRNRPHSAWRLILLIAVVALIGLLLIKNGTNEKQIGNATISNVNTYLSSSSADENKLKQDEFTYGDPIQLGFSYEYPQEDSEENNKETIKVSVVDQSDEKVFETNLFNLSDDNGELFISINNTSLPASSYTANILDKEDSVITSVKFKIVEQ